jgi:MoaA/NifB/PqqE/SkfB family radical SAM enzyme
MPGRPSDAIVLADPKLMSERRRNSLLNHQETLRRQIVLESRPRMLFIELTRACNLACPMCRPVIMSGRHLAMPPAVLARIEEELFPYAEVVDLRGFGESALDDRLLGLTDKLHAQGVQTKILTNLSPRQPKYWYDLGSRPMLVGISLEAVGKDDYEATRVGARWERFNANLTALRRAQLERGGLDDIYFNIVVFADNLDQLTSIVETAHDAQVPLVTLNPISGYEEGSTYPKIGVDAKAWPKLWSALEAAQQRAEALGVDVRVNANLAAGRSCSGGYDQCLHPWSYVFIRYDGGVGFCDHLVAHDDSILGSMADQSFMAVWNSEAYQQVRREHAGGDFARLAGLGIECDWCYENRYVDHEYMIEPALSMTTVPEYLES